MSQNSALFPQDLRNWHKAGAGQITSEHDLRGSSMGNLRFKVCLKTGAIAYIYVN
ncbi:hypothetical protein [Scytonema sp. HK-05]|uniref:hypothetical protein n=1 Tax=Scytonema sp. HK-05 TaxID=1137095 RepID=UPI000A8A134A|nr:hypothetical protein [Scytonema sp. HK-05]